MTNDQKFLGLLNQVEELLKTLDKVDQSKGLLYNHQARLQRNALKIMVAQNRLFRHTVDTSKKRKAPTLFSHHHNWLSQ